MMDISIIGDFQINARQTKHYQISKQTNKKTIKFSRQCDSIRYAETSDFIETERKLEQKRSICVK